MKHPPVVLVEFVDAANAASGWDDREKVIHEALGYVEDPIVATGFLLADNPVGVVLGLLLNHHSDDVGHVFAIPRSAIREVLTLRKAHDWEIAA